MPAIIVGRAGRAAFARCPVSAVGHWAFTAHHRLGGAPLQIDYREFIHTIVNHIKDRNQVRLEGCVCLCLCVRVWVWVNAWVRVCVCVHACALPYNDTTALGMLLLLP